MFGDLLTPDGHIPLAQAVLRAARAADPETWGSPDLRKEEEAIYAGLGFNWEPFELWAAFSEEHERDELSLWLPVDRRRIEAIRAAANGQHSEDRYSSYRAAEKVLRRALYTGAVPFVLQHPRTAELFDSLPVLWGQMRAPKWFSTGCIPVPDGGTERHHFGAGWFTDPNKQLHLDVPTGSKYHVLIPEEGLSAFLEERFVLSSPGAVMLESTVAAHNELRRTEGLFGANARWSMDQLLIWLAERDGTPDFAAARRSRGNPRRPLSWLEYRSRRGAKSSLDGIEAQALECLKTGRLTVTLADEPETVLSPHWFEDKALIFKNDFGAVLKEVPLYLEGPTYEVSLSARQVLALYPPVSIKEGVEPETIDEGIYPFAVAWRRLVYHLSRELSRPIGDVAEEATARIKSACVASRLRLFGYQARDGRPHEEEIEMVPPERIRSLCFDPLAGQPHHEYRDGRPWREYGAATLTNEHGPLRWTGLHFKRAEFDAAFKTGESTDTAPPRIPEPLPTPTPRRAASKADTEAAYLAWVEKHTNTKPPSREEDADHMRSLFPTIRRERVRELRATLAPAGWRKSGPKNSGK